MGGVMKSLIAGLTVLALPLVSSAHHSRADPLVNLN